MLVFKYIERPARLFCLPVLHFTGKGVLEGCMRRERKGAGNKKQGRTAGRYDGRKSLQIQKELECLEGPKAQRWVALGVSSTILLLPNESSEYYWDPDRSDISQEVWSITLAMR